MTPEELESLLKGVPELKPPDELERKFLRQAKKLMKDRSGQNVSDGRGLPKTRLLGILSVAASLIICVSVLWVIFSAPSSEGILSAPQEARQVENPDRALDALRARAQALKPKPDQVIWKKTPWTTDLIEGIRSAKKENRPLCLWATVSDPLERC